MMWMSCRETYFYISCYFTTGPELTRSIQAIEIDSSSPREETLFHNLD